jgi:DNA invertase Pin-like site-specific DNA recombinase
VRGATGFRSLTEAKDTTTAAGRMMMQMLGSFADHAERAIMQSRTAEVAVRPAC